MTAKYGKEEMAGEKKVLAEIARKLVGKRYGELFPEVRQRVAAYKLYRTFWKMERYGVEGESRYLDGAYRFLNSSVEAAFIVFCSKFEHMDPMEYLSGLLGDDAEADPEYIVYHYTKGDSHGLPYVTNSKDDAFDHARKWCIAHRISDKDPHTSCVIIDANADEAIGYVANWSEKQDRPVAMAALLEMIKNMENKKEEHG